MQLSTRNFAPTAALLTLAALSSAACPAPGQAPGDFIALATDLDGYHSWQSYDAGNMVVDQVHSDGFRTDYIACTQQPGFNCHLPRHGDTAFTEGIVIIKEVQMTDGGAPEIFAMAKRGGGFNDGGAVNWEWFDLVDAGPPGDNVTIVWRGDGPPQGSTYGASHEACNECHSLSQANDFVASPPLQLTNF